MNFLHRWLNPHCENCAIERQEKKVCSSCNILKQLLEAEKFENRQLIESILALTQPKVEVVQELTKQELKPNVMNWPARRRILEQEDRIKAAVEKKAKETIVPDKSLEELEKQMEIVKEYKDASTLS